MPTETGKNKCSSIDKNIVILLNDKLIDSNQEKIGLKILPHPRTGDDTLFLEDNDGKFYQLIKQTKGLQSWFIDDSVEEDGSFYITMEFDCLFIILPYIMKLYKYVPLDNIEIDDSYQALANLLHNKNLMLKLPNITDTKCTADEHVYKFNMEKTLDWCEPKINAIQKVLIDKGIDTLSGSRASTYISTDKNGNEGSSKLDALELFCDLLPNEISEKLYHRFSFDFKATQKMKDESTPKRQKGTPVNPNEDYSKAHQQNKKKTTVNLTTAQKKLNKGATGMKKLDSFFKAPKKS